MPASHESPALALPTVLEAFRLDAGRPRADGEPADDVVAHWLATAFQLERAVAGTATERTTLLASLQPPPGNLLASALDRWAAGEAPWVAAVAQTVFAMERALYYTLADVVVGHAVHLTDPQRAPRTHGRLLALRARVARHRGEPLLATAWYGAVRELARRTREPELEARGRLGLAALAHAAGDYPTARTHYRSLVAAKDIPQALTAAGHHGLVGATAIAGDYAGAAVHAWRGLASAETPEEEAELLLNCAQLLYLAGHHAPALQGFGAGLRRRPPERLRLPLLGGFMRAAARTLRGRERTTVLGRIEVALWAQEQRYAPGDGTHAYMRADACLDAADALTVAGQATAARAFLDRAGALARAHGLHEIGHRLETWDPPASATAPENAPENAPRGAAPREFRQLLDELSRDEGADVLGALVEVG